MTTLTGHTSRSAETANDITLPRFCVLMDDTSPSAAKLDGVKTTAKILRKAFRVTYNSLFSPATAPSHVKSVIVFLKTIIEDSPGSSVESYFKNGEVHVIFSLRGEYFEMLHAEYDVMNRMAGIGTTWEMIEELNHFLLPQFSDDSYPSHFQQGLADYVRLKNGVSFPSHHDAAKILDGYLWYDRDTMPYFFDFLDKKYGEGTVHRLIAEMGAPYDKNVFEKVTGTPIANLWKLYRAFIGITETQGNEWLSDLDELWLVPRLNLRIDADPTHEHEGLTVLLDKFKPKDVLAKAVLSTFKHLYTPRTVPTYVEELSLVLRSGMKTYFTELGTEYIVSLEHIESFMECAMECLMSFVFRTYASQNSRISEAWVKIIVGYLFLKENPNTLREIAWDGCLSDFLFWLDNTPEGKGIVTKFIQRFEIEEYEVSWFEMTGKTLHDLFIEFTASVPEAAQSKDPEPKTPVYELADLPKDFEPETPVYELAYLPKELEPENSVSDLGEGPDSDILFAKKDVNGFSDTSTFQDPENHGDPTSSTVTIMEHATEVCEICDKIISFIAEHDVLRTDNTTSQISSLVSQVQNVVTPVLRRKAINDPLRHSLRDTESVLRVVLKNLTKWNETRSHGRLHISTLTYSAWATPKDIKENRENLIYRHADLVRVVQLVMRPRGYNIISPMSSIRSFLERKSVQKMKMREYDERDEAAPFEVNEFWKCSIGSETEFASSEQFCDLLSSWLDEELDEIARKRLLLRLDEHHTGYISFSTFEFYVRNGRIREDVHIYSSDPHLPLLIWIDSDITTVCHQVTECTTLGVTVIQFASTETLKTWLSINLEFLKTHDDPSKIRFISNQVLHERNAAHQRSDNEDAGRQILSHIREIGLRCPMIVYTPIGNISATKYVEEYDMAGSVSGNYNVFHEYVSLLAKGSPDSGRWMKYNAWV